jgi:hypothetical protein
MFIVTAPYVVHSNKQEIIKENDFTDDTLLLPICFSDNCFVTKSKMTTDEAVVIKKCVKDLVERSKDENIQRCREASLAAYLYSLKSENMLCEFYRKMVHYNRTWTGGI